MARRDKPNAIDGLMGLVALLPWWAGLALAVISYFLLHIAATQITVPPAQPGQISSVVAAAAWKSLASFAQYGVPAICVLGAAISFWRRRQREQLVTHVSHNPASDALDGMSWREFELLVGEGFRQQGYKVLETGGGGADGGVDLVLSKPGENGSEKFLVQCKQWRAQRVSVEVVRELYGVMAARGAAGGFVVTSGRFTDDAVKFATGRNVALMDGPKLMKLIRPAGTAATPSSPPRYVRSEDQPRVSPNQTMTCPVCTKPMVRRVAKRGANAGREFWGCTGYPECRGTRPIA